MKLFTDGMDTIISETAKSAKKEWANETGNSIEDANDFREFTKWPFIVYSEDAPEGNKYHSYHNVDEILKDFPAHQIIFSTEW